jgi:hypothetical protein
MARRMEDPSHYSRSTAKNNRGRGRAGRNIVARNPSAQETKNGPRQDDTDRRRAKEDRDPEREEGERTTTQGTTEAS